MFRNWLFGVLMSSTFAFAAPAFVGKKLTLVEQGVLVTNLLDVISGVSGLNIVLLDPAPVAQLDVKAERQPWDQLLDDVVKRSGLAMRREGNVVVVGTAARLGARPAAKYTGKRIKLALRDADVRDALELVSRMTNLELAAAAPGARTLTVWLKNVPGDQLAALLLELADAKPAVRKPPAPVTGCAAPKTPLARLKLVGTATGTADPRALVRDENGASWFVGLKDCLGSEKAAVKHLMPEKLLTLGTHDLFLSGVAFAHDSPKTEPVLIDALLTELDAPGALAGTGRTGALAHKRLVLRFLRDVLGWKQLDEPLPRDERERLSAVPSTVGDAVDAALAGGLHAKPEVLAPFVAAELTLADSRALEPWLRLETGDRAAALKSVTAMLSDLETDAAALLDIASTVEEKKVTVLEGPAPQALGFLPAALAKLKTLGVPAKELAGLEKRLKALQAHYPGP